MTLFHINTCIRRNMSKSVSDFLSTIDDLPALHDRLSNVIVNNTDGLELITKYSTPNVFIYCDPPYEQSTRTSTRYAVDMNFEQHMKFLEVISGSKAKILLSGYDCNSYNILEEKGWDKIQFIVNTIDGNRQPKEKVETLWKNYTESSLDIFST